MIYYNARLNLLGYRKGNLLEVEEKVFMVLGEEWELM
jgi:hypothetical protein